MYTLAGINNPQTGWGLAGETWSFMDMMRRLGGETWFRLGDQDLATHVERTRRLAAGETLSQVTAAFCARLGVRARVVPMSDQAVRTVVQSDAGELAFQDYFVRLRCEPAVRGLRFDGASAAVGAPFAAAFQDASLEGIVICPSNPYLSIGPMLALNAVERSLRQRRVPAVAVSPIIAGRAVKGPAEKIMRELGREASALEVARTYRGLIDGFVLDLQDAALAPEVEALGIRAIAVDTLMSDAGHASALAREALQLIAALH
jgi:LPPG:FO 2-phospho-L-lactate transferase